MKAIAAMSLNRVIGREGKVPWHLPEDFRWFKRCTEGQVVAMGRKTFDSLGAPLKNRHHVVFTRGPALPGAESIADLSAFNPRLYAPREVWLIGGAEIYAHLLNACSDLYLTIVPLNIPGDAFFPSFETEFERVGPVLRTADFEVIHYRRTLPPPNAG